MRLVPAFCVLGFALTGCTMISSYPVEKGQLASPGQAAGSYFLAKHILRVTVVQAGAKANLTVESAAVQDRTALIQTGFDLSPASEDDITVTYQAGLLASVTASAKDKTGEILTEIAKIAGSFRETKAPAAPGKVYEFDPFIPSEAAQTNAILWAKYRSCVEVEIEPGLWSPGCGKLAMGRTASWDSETRLSSAPDAAGDGLSGLYYRRSLDHRVHVVENGSTTQVNTYKFANAAPVFRVDIKRTLFVERRTELVFAGGELTSIHVNKPSEGLALAQLPLAIAKAYMNAPVSALSNHQAVQTSEANLNTARAAAITHGAGLNSAGASDPSSPRTATAGDLRQAAIDPKIASDCANIKVADPALCASLLKNRTR
jgi:hypothetical protein